MDWNLFWTAFGAIGTTLGSMITAIAVVIAVRQYRQPIEKKVLIEVHSAIVPFKKGNYITVDFYNKGTRPFTINSLYIKGKTTKLYLNLMQTLTEYTGSLPIKVDAEENGKIFFKYDNFFSEIDEYVKKGELKKNKSIVFIAEDSTGDKHVYKSKIKPN